MALLPAAIIAVSHSPSARADDAIFFGSAADGSHAFFATEDALVAADRDDAIDVYEWSSSRPRLLIRPSGLPPNHRGYPELIQGVSEDGRRLVISTNERLTSSDSDPEADLYLVTEGGARLLTHAIADPQSRWASDLIRLDAAGDRVYFETAEPLVAADTDAELDAYLDHGGSTSLISPGTDGPIHLLAVGDGGRALVFSTSEALEPTEDSHAASDIYELRSGDYDLISTGPGSGACEQFRCGVQFEGASPDGARIYFRTSRRLTPDDRDTEDDVFLWSGGEILRIEGGVDPAVVALSRDGASFLIESSSALTSDDHDAAFGGWFGFGRRDLFRWAAGRYELVTAGLADNTFPGATEPGAHFRGASADLSHVAFRTHEQLARGDAGDDADIYEAFRGRSRLVTRGDDGNGESHFSSISRDGSIIKFSSPLRMLPSDHDRRLDIYSRQDGALNLLTKRETGGGVSYGNFFAASSANGRITFFSTRAGLAGRDRDAGETDIYRLSGGRMDLVSRPMADLTDPSPVGALLTASGGPGKIFFERLCTRPRNPCAAPSGIYAYTPGGGPLRRVIPDERGTDPAISPGGQLLAFVSHRTGNPDVFIKRLGGGTVQVTGDRHRDVAPEFLPDGRLSFRSDRDGDWDVYATEIGSGLISRVGEEVASSTARGLRIVAVSCAGGTCDLVVRKRDGRVARRIETPDLQESSASFSPDGSMIGFVARRGSPGACCGSPGVFLMRADGTGKRSIAPASYGRTYENLRFSPDGRSLVYVVAESRPHLTPGGALVIRDLRNGARRFVPGVRQMHEGDPAWQSVP